MDGSYIKLNNNKHIVILSPGFPANEKDSTCIPALQILIKHLSKVSNIKISIIAFQYPYKEGRYIWNGCDVYALNGKNSKGLLRLRTWRKAFRIFGKLYKAGKIHRIHSFWLTECAYVGNKLSKKHNIIHSTTLMGQDVLLSNKYYKKIRPLPELIAVSEFQNNELLKNRKIQTEYTIPFGSECIVNTEKERTIDVLGVGSLIPLKQFDVFLKIINEVKFKSSDIKVEIVGDGPQRSNIEQMVVKLNLENNVKICGELSNENVIAKMKKTRIFLHTSQYESFGMVLNEALSCGAKVISKPVGIAIDFEEIIKYESIVQASALINDTFELDPDFISGPFYNVEQTVNQYLNLWLM